MRVRTRRLVGLVVVALASAVIIGALWGGLDASGVQSFVDDLGWWGPVAFVIAMWAIQPFGIPGAVFMVPAAALWSPPLAVALAWLGNMGASTFAFAFARWFGRDWVQDRIPPRVARFDGRLSEGGVREVLALRVVTGQLPPADWLLGVSSVRWRPFLLGTGVGIVPGILLFVVGGGGLLQLFR